MSKSRIYHFVNVGIGLFLLWYGIWLISGGIGGLAYWREAEISSGIPRDGHTILLWYTLNIDALCSILFGILHIGLFVYVKSGIFWVRLTICNLLRYVLGDFIYFLEMRFTMTSINSKRLFLPIILISCGIWWNRYCKKKDLKASKWLPFVGELCKAIKG